jgi:hypothetical protein
VADVLNRLLNNAQYLVHLKGLGHIGSFSSILNFHFTVDTLLFLKAKEKYNETLKWILIDFEDLSCLKINFDKYEMVPLNILDEEGLHLVNHLDYKLTYLSLTYLGVPLSL